MHSRSLVEGGYQPLPVKRGKKYCGLRGWQDIHRWNGEADGLGLNLTGLVMIDVDIDVDLGSEEDELISELVDLIPGSSVAPLRQRPGSSRCALLMRCPEVGVTESKRLWTGRWRRGDTFARVELKAGKGEFMFGWGVHPSGKRLIWDLPDFEEGVTQPEPFPPMMKLPILELKLAELRERLHQHMLTAWGPPIQEGSERGDLEVLADLDWAQAFTTPEGNVEVLRSLYVGPETDRWVNLTPWRPDSDSGGGHVIHSEAHDGPMVMDFVTWTAHVLPEDFTWSTDITDQTRELGIGQTPSPQEATLKREGLAMAEREHRMIYVRQENKYGYVDADSTALMPLAGAFHGYTPKERTAAAARVPAVQRQIWDPRKPALSVIANPKHGWNEHNVFWLPPHMPDGGETAPFWAFLKGFIPDDFERGVFQSWLAHKVQRPEWRSFATVFVGPQGSGKGSIWKLVGKLWGHHNVSSLANITSIMHGQYQDSLYRRLWVLIDEVSGEEAGSEWAQKRKAADRLKGFVEPQPSWKVLNIKGRRYEDSLVAATVGIATNHPDALPLDPDDRRFFVVQTGPILAPHERLQLHTWMDQPRNIGALWRELYHADLAGFDAVTAPVTQGKDHMRDANRTDLDDKIDDFIDIIEKSGGVFTHSMSVDYGHHVGLDWNELRSFKRELRRRSSERVVKRDGGARRIRMFDRGLSTHQPTELVKRLVQGERSLQDRLSV